MFIMKEGYTDNKWGYKKLINFVKDVIRVMGTEFLGAVAFKGKNNY